MSNKGRTSIGGDRLFHQMARSLSDPQSGSRDSGQMFCWRVFQRIWIPFLDSLRLGRELQISVPRSIQIAADTKKTRTLHLSINNLIGWLKEWTEHYQVLWTSMKPIGTATYLHLWRPTATPAEMMLGYNLRLPADLVFGCRILLFLLGPLIIPS